MAFGAGAGGGGCGSSSSSGGATSDGGDDSSYYGPPPSDGSAEGEGGGDGGPDGPTCIVPASANISEPVNGGGTATCSPQVPNGQCDSMSFRLECDAPDPNDLPVPPLSLGCNVVGNTTSTRWFYCCACQATATGGGNH